MQLNFNNRLILDTQAGALLHVFGQGYCIIDEQGQEVSSLENEKEFNRLIEKFKWRHFLMEALEKKHHLKVAFGTDNCLLINGEPLQNSYWNLPQSEYEVPVYVATILSVLDK